MRLGAQLYTLREYTKTLHGIEETLKKVADIGYTAVQLSGTCEYDPAWMAEQLRRNGLVCAATHTAPKRLLSDLPAVVQGHKVLDCDYVGIGAMPAGDTLEQRLDTFIHAFKSVAQTIHDNGLYFMYHNHSYEFEKIDGIRVIDRLIEEFSPNEMGFTVDTYWVQVGGAEPSALIESLKDRVPCVHFKDMAIRDSKQMMVPVGRGNLDFEKILAACEKAHTKYVLVEQDNCYGEDPFECLRDSLYAMRALGIE